MKNSTYLLFIMFIALSGSTMAGCAEKEAHAESSTENKKQSNKSGVAAEESSVSENESVRAANIKVETVMPSNLTEYIVANGTTQAIRELTYSAEVPGRIEALSVDIGDRIRKGRVLARIDFTTLEAQSQQAQTSYNLAKSTYERLAVLKDEDIISKQRIDEA